MPGTRTAVHDEDAGEIGPDRLVLLDLDRGDDVAHPTGAGPVEAGEQRALAHDGQTGLARGAGVEDLVVEADELTAVPGRVMKWRRRTTPIGAIAVAR